MNCRDIRDNLTPYLLGDLDPARAAEVRAHVQDCAACRAEAEDMQAALQFLRKSLADTPGTPAQLPEKFTRQFQKRNRRRPRVVRQGAAPRRWRFRIVEFAAVAAILLVLAGLLLPNTASVRERARRVNDLSNLNGLWKAASAWGLEPVNTWRPAFPDSIDDVMKESGLTPEILVNTETKQPVEYYPGASDTDGNRPLLVSRGKTGRNVVTVSGQGRWVADGTPEAEALNRQLAELPKQFATVTPGSFAREGGAKRAPAGHPAGKGAASLPANKPGKGGAVPEDDRKNGEAFTEVSGVARARGESGAKEGQEKKGGDFLRSSDARIAGGLVPEYEIAAGTHSESGMAGAGEKSEEEMPGAAGKPPAGATAGGPEIASRPGREPESGMDSSINGQEIGRLAKVRDFQKAWSVEGSTRAIKAQAAEQPQPASEADEKAQSSPTLAGDKSDTVLRDSDRYEQGRGGAGERFETVNGLERTKPPETAAQQPAEKRDLMNAAPPAASATAPVSTPEPAISPSSGLKIETDMSRNIKNAETTRLMKVREFQKGWAVKSKGRATKAEFALFKAKYKDGDWDCNPDALNNLMSQICSWAKNSIKAKIRSEVVDVGSGQLFDVKPPFIYLTGEKDFRFTDQEIKNMRDYLLVGGAIWADNAGPGKGTPFDLALRREMKRVLPDRDFEDIPSDHDIYNSYFDNLSLPKGINVKPEPNEEINIGGETAVLYTLNGYGSLWDRYTLNTNNHVEVVPGKTNFGRILPEKSTTSDALVKDAYKLGVNATVHLLTRYQDKLRALPEDIASPVTPAAAPAPSPEPAQSNAPPVPVFRAIGVNQFVTAAANPFSTFSIDVDTASYTLSRNYILRGQLPPPEAVRTEEFVNFFDYDYAPPAGPTFGVYTDCGPSAFGRGKSLLKIGVKGRRLGREEKRAAALTLLIDTSGSMATPDRIELVKSALSLMVERLDPADRVAIVQYDSHARLLLEHTPAAEKKRIIGVIESLQTSGSTALEEGMRAAYAAAARGFDGAACNRVLLLSDGMANLGAAAAEEILKSVAGYRKQGITLSVFGFGLGAYNDDMLETLADKGDGVYAFIDSPAEARRALVDDLAATINLIARDVKIQVEFDPKRVRQYRQLGYENRQLKKEQFRDDSVDAGEIGSGQSVTALYELELQGDSREPLGIVRVRCRNALTGQMEEIEQPVAPPSGATPFEAMDVRFRLAAAAAEFSEILRGSPFAAGSSFGDVARVLRPVALELSIENRIQEFLRMAEMGLTPKFQEAGPP